MKYTITEFARYIRNQYPNDYDDLTDQKLVELWLKKYPNDFNKIVQSQSNMKEKSQSAEIRNDLNEIFNEIILNFLFWAGVIIMLLGLTGLFISTTSIIEQQTTTFKTYVGNDSDVSYFLFTLELYVIKYLIWLKGLPSGVKIGGIIAGGVLCIISYRKH